VTGSRASLWSATRDRTLGPAPRAAVRCRRPAGPVPETTTHPDPEETRPVFEYFPDNYSWSLSVMIALAMGGEIDEIDRACRGLRSRAAARDAEADLAWFDAWAAEGTRVRALADADHDAGRRWAAARKYLRAATYLLLAERQTSVKSERTLEVYRQGLECFRRGVELDDRPVEFVDVPYDGAALPALFLPAADVAPGTRPPCMIHFDGLDVMKEIIYLMHVSELPRYGVSVLICDHPGVGEALRLRDLRMTPDVERPAAACIDWLEERGDVDPDRIGIMALSLGGYYAPRAAAFEPRLKACVVWGAIWDMGRLYELTKQPGFARSVDLESTFSQVMGVDGGQEELERRLAELTLEPIIDRVRCPLLVVHGENDRQAPLWTAEHTHAGAVNSAARELRVLTKAEGGAEHCQLDNVTMGTDYMFDWIARTFGVDYAGSPAAPVDMAAGSG